MKKKKKNIGRTDHAAKVVRPPPPPSQTYAHFTYHHARNSQNCLTIFWKTFSRYTD
jgi:hypothetical protein